jgi:diacylglycerol kinase family enzyme
VRALLVYNPNATTTRPGTIDAIATALAKDLKLDVEATKRRDHASFLAAGAVHDGYEVVLALGGDGTANEVLQGLALTDVRFGLLPGGSTNVWARNLGLPNDAREAAAWLLEALRARRERQLPLGRANGRWFGVNAGFGYDAEVVRFVERRHRLKRTVRQATFLYCGALAYLTGYDRRSVIRVVADGERAADALRSAVVCNANPYTYLGRLPVQLCPDASYATGLDLLGLTELSLPRVARLARAALATGDLAPLPFARSWHDRRELTLTSDRPLPLQLDGDFVGEATRVLIEHVDRAVTVLG